MGGGGGRGGWWAGVLCVWAAVAAAGQQQASGQRSAAAAVAASQQQQQQHSAPAASCRGLHQAAVDWWLMLKHPGGYRYSYIDSSGAAGGWRHGLSMVDPNPVSHTLGVLAAGSSKCSSARLAHVVYNDADPAGVEHFDHAHAKGVVAFSRVGNSSSHNNSSSSSVAGFWFVHSAPRFPAAPGSPGWTDLQHAQSVFGQHFSCFSLGGSRSIAAVADALLAAGPYIYSSQLPASLAAAFPGWLNLTQGGSDGGAHAVSAVVRLAASRQLLRVFAKTSALNVSLTDAVVGPGLGAPSMLWETWRRSHDALPSACSSSSSSSSLNVVRIAFPRTPYAWQWSQDHSKWGISSGSNSGSDAVCVGDQNRASYQSHRGGTFVCMQNRGLWQALHAIVAAAEACHWPAAA